MLSHRARNILLVSVMVLSFLPRAMSSQAVEPGAKPKKEVRLGKLHIEVTDKTGVPVQSAEVWVKSVEERGAYDEQITTNKQGKANFSKVPRVRLLIQVTSKAMSTFRTHYDLDQETKTIPVQLQAKATRGSSA